MGNKISLGKCVCYCGFPAKRRKTKQREEEKRWEKEEMERYEIYLRAEKFKADYPEYCKKAGIGPWAKVTVQPSEETSEENQRTKDHSASTVGALSSSTKKQPLKPSDIYTRKPSSISKYSRNESSTRSSARTPAATSPKHVLSDAIQLKDNKVGSKDGQSSECTAVKEGNMTGVLGSSNDIIHNEPSPSSSFKDIDPQLHSTLKPMSPPPAEFTCPKTPPPSPVSRDITLTSSQSHVPAQPAGQTRPRLSSSRPPPPPLVTRDITPTTSQSPVPTPPVVKTRLKPSSSRPPPPLPVPRDMTLTTLQAPVPAPPAVSRKRPSRRPVRSVTFVDTPDVLSIPSSSFDDLRECFPPKSSSTSSSSNGAELFLKKSKQLVPKEVKTQSTGNKSRENNCRTLSTFKPSGTEDRRSKPLPPSFKWNGRCVYDSGYPSLMVGDRIESASEDEELWEKNIANFDGRPSVKRRGSKPPRKFTSSPDICDALRGLQEEIRELRSDSKHLRIGLPRVLESFDRRQRLLEACMDALEPQGTFVAFQESDEESASTELNSLRGDLERVNNRVRLRGKSRSTLSTTSQARVLYHATRGKTLVTAGHVSRDFPQNLGGKENSV